MTRQDAFPLRALVLGVILAGLVGGSTALGQTDTAVAGGMSETCLDCHDDHAASLDGGPHAVVLDDGAAYSKLVSCTSCHTGDVGHWEDDPEVYAMSVPGLDGVADAAATCNQCHDSAHQTDQATMSAHARNDVDCLDCHQVHDAPVAKQLSRPQPELCFTCHGELRAKFTMSSRHPAGQRDFMSCTDCHLATDDRMAALSRRGRNEACTTCHPEFRGPFPFEHQATLDYATAEGGCVTCHDPHGSSLPMLLKQPYDPPHQPLCTQCHIVPRHNFNNQHGAEFAGVSCAECHVDVHGSYTSRLLLSPTLEAQGCFAVGCHSR